MQNIVRLQYVWFLVCDFSQSMKCSSVEIFKCSSVCEKQLNCGKHFCKEICHEGPCDPCTEVIKQGKRSQPFILKGRRKLFNILDDLPCLTWKMFILNWIIQFIDFQIGIGWKIIKINTKGIWWSLNFIKDRSWMSVNFKIYLIFEMCDFLQS